MAKEKKECEYGAHVDFAYWVNDAQGIPLCKACDHCIKEKLKGYRPEILTGYDQSDVDEPIEPDY